MSCQPTRTPPGHVRRSLEMGTMAEQLMGGIDYLRSVTDLLDRIRTTHPTAGPH